MLRTRISVLAVLCLALAIPGVSPASPGPYDLASTDTASLPEGLGSATADITTGALSVSTAVGDDETLSVYGQDQKWSRAHASVSRTYDIGSEDRFNTSVTIAIPSGDGAPYATANPDVPSSSFFGADAFVQVTVNVTTLSCKVDGSCSPATKSKAQYLACADLLAECGAATPELVFTETGRPIAAADAPSQVIVEVEIQSYADTGIPAGYSASSGASATVTDISLTIL